MRLPYESGRVSSVPFRFVSSDFSLVDSTEAYQLYMRLANCRFLIAQNDVRLLPPQVANYQAWWSPIPNHVIFHHFGNDAVDMIPGVLL